MAAMGGGRINPHPCTDEDKDNFYMEVSNQVFVLNQAVLGGAVDAFTFIETIGGTPGAYDDKVNGQEPGGTYNASDHQLVWYQIESDGTITPFTLKGTGGGTDEEVKVTSGGTPGRLEEVIHADSWEATDTYDSADHFIILAAPPTASTVRFYAPWNIIKNSAGDGAPGYHYAKHADQLTYSGSDHTLCYNHDTGSAVRTFVKNEDIEALAEGAVEPGGIRLCKILSSATVNPAVQDGSGNLTPGTTSGLIDLTYNSGTGKYEPGSTLSNVIYPDPTPVNVISGRWKVGKLKPDFDDPTKLVLFEPSCYSFEEL